MTTKAHATIEDLYALPDNQKAEIVDGELILISPTGDAPGYAADEVFVSLREHSRSTGRGRAFAANKGFIVNMPNRDSFSPDAAYYWDHAQAVTSCRAPRCSRLRSGAKAITAQRRNSR
jgi:Uma2 family endonuclease